MTYDFTQNWFSYQRPVHEKILSKLVGPLRILEIGAYEGNATTWFLDNHMDHAESSITCIDPFDTSDSTTPVTSVTESRFRDNVSKTGKDHKVLHLKNTSTEALTAMVVASVPGFTGTISKLPNSFNYIIIDGSHLAKDVLTDAMLAFEILEAGGIMFFDDYLGGDEIVRKTLASPHLAINAFLSIYKDRITVLHKEYHVVVFKAIIFLLIKMDIRACIYNSKNLYEAWENCQNSEETTFDIFFKLFIAYNKEISSDLPLLTTLDLRTVKLLSTNSYPATIDSSMDLDFATTMTLEDVKSQINTSLTKLQRTTFYYPDWFLTRNFVQRIQQEYDKTQAEKVNMKILHQKQECAVCC